MQDYLDKVNGKIELLPITSIKYLRRLVKALKAHSWNGFYGYQGDTGERFNQARLRKGKLQVRLCDDEWQDASNMTFGDPNGNAIAASRHPKWSE